MTILRMAIAAASLATAQPAAAQQTTCAPRADLIGQLQEVYGETRQGSGLQGETMVMEVYASATRGTWTIVYTRPDGVSCAVAAGDAWQNDDAPAAGGAPA